MSALVALALPCTWWRDIYGQLTTWQKNARANLRTLSPWPPPPTLLSRSAPRSQYSLRLLSLALWGKKKNPPKMANAASLKN